jgi:ribonuclease T1
MSIKNNNPNRKQSYNRPTDPFGGPPRGRNPISFGFILIVLAFFMLLQWAGVDLGGLLSGSATVPTAAVTTPAANGPSATLQPTSTVHAATQEVAVSEAPAAKATGTSRPQQTPAPTNTVRAITTQTTRPTTQPTPTANAPPVLRASELPTIAYDELPPEAHETIALIEQGGPFPYRQDGATFQNRERLLPLHPEGYYREYTIITPHADNRGARRIVTGEAGEMYYTDDHYDSFREIIR